MTIHKHKQYKYQELATNTAKYLQRINQSDGSISVQVIITGFVGTDSVASNR